MSDGGTIPLQDGSSESVNNFLTAQCAVCKKNCCRQPTKLHGCSGWKSIRTEQRVICSRLRIMFTFGQRQTNMRWFPFKLFFLHQLPRFTQLCAAHQSDRDAMLQQALKERKSRAKANEDGGKGDHGQGLKDYLLNTEKTDPDQFIKLLLILFCSGVLRLLVHIFVRRLKAQGINFSNML